MHQLVQWHPNYSVFVKELDDQHKQLIDMLNELYNSYLQDIHKGKVGEIITQMHDYAKVHFAAEEKYFAAFGYENSKEHIQEHSFFLEKVKNFESEYEKNSTIISVQIINFLQEWLTNHILNADKDYMTCFKKGGLK